ncbi:hypothetical protein [Microbacterium sp.]|uniref:hypothetical protein n=1 Tax=Microbacterium sp. TaxID=51671 RepID=UPI002CF832EC|nr:hypothetical protein [Microbacterium sp.]HWL79097.1 hypothetical protein [Microbacterium sp.]
MRARPVAPFAPTASTPAQPSPAREVVLSVEAFAYTHDDVTETISLDDGPGILAALEEITGHAPPAVELDGWYDRGLVEYEWPEVRVLMSVEDQSQVWITVSAPEIDGVPFRTAEGIAVGSTRADAVAAGAVDLWDEDQDGIADHLQLGRHEVPGTTSLVTGEIGILFVELAVEDDVVSRISAPMNDFSDI